MNKYLITAAIAILFTLTGHTQSTRQFLTDWEGKLNVGVELRLIFHINEKPGIGLTATADSPDQSAFGLKCDTVIVTGDSIKIEMHALRAVFTGKLIADSVINGTFTQGNSFPLVLKKGAGKIEPLKRPQTPKAPFPYKSENVEYDNADHSLHYGATITIPEGKGPFPALVLITGSGAQDRDETMLVHKPFAVLADALTRNGFIVLRVDDRGIGKSTGNFSAATSADFAKDVNTSFDYLLARPEVDKKKAGLAGHSEGGMIAPMVASQRKDVNFVVLLAGPGIKIDSLMTEQNIAVMTSAGLSQPAAEAYRQLYRQLLKQYKGDADSATLNTTALRLVHQWRAVTDTSLLKELDLNNTENDQPMLNALATQYNSVWFHYFINFDPQPYLQQLNCKVLALNGSRDVQVISRSNLAGIEAALKKNKNKNYTVKEMPGLNHLFQTCVKCSVKEYGELEETFSPIALQEINTWLNKNVK